MNIQLVRLIEMTHGRVCIRDAAEQILRRRVQAVGKDMHLSVGPITGLAGVDKGPQSCWSSPVRSVHVLLDGRGRGCYRLGANTRTGPEQGGNISTRWCLETFVTESGGGGY
jgi:hypothetical protein